ncbi:GntR family transcriptional regulator, transcriptional repressor for pyruvate dehydrogenase complex [Paenibacillus algorifonticola]|uniref:GntR family transcriptional regulator, transcriptional repressor for pyruvate dehydrogenase complex n=1 Tax=Paenibacillus algorifonticola TaxID=684063 RepID=A0A1I1ZB35_9BACL|nr:FadR/GntR family transcriptional regulator [Paenibacillus algorifonticola]SFE27743.1 GntR family transcriptional regulator, transcriptional repressor for pyruvate dehydrogenase complex [Paenibacillus algorifonticola]
MEISPNRPLKSYEWVMNDIKRKMEDGSLAPGDRLSSVADLAASYGVGQSTIREALSALRAMGRLNIRQGSGTYVTAPPEPASITAPSFLYDEAWMDRAQTLRHILEVRKVLETGCAALAARNRTEADLAALASILQSMNERLGDEAFSEQADIRFHQELAKATHNPVLLEMMESLSSKLHESMKDTRALWFYAERSTAERLLDEHQGIYEAIVGRQPAEASQLMEAHISKVESVLLGKLASG